MDSPLGRAGRWYHGLGRLGLRRDRIRPDRSTSCSESSTGGQGAIFDGYPRTQAQAEALDRLLEARGRRLNHVIELTVDENALVARIVGRFTCAVCGEGYHDSFKRPKIENTCDVCGSHEFKRRPDDNEETVRTRMAEYRAKTAPILPYYEQRKLVSRVDGMADIDDVGAAIDAVLER